MKPFKLALILLLSPWLLMACQAAQSPQESTDPATKAAITLRNNPAAAKTLNLKLLESVQEADFKV